MLSEGPEMVDLAATGPLSTPVLAVGAGGGDFTHTTLSRVTAGPVRKVQLEGVGHYAATEAPGELAAALLDFYRAVDAE
jgi:pimeloyl-ACP methyl ester carboxylesterase